jgi:flavin reductase (DIM6/NTAB) family NADH-FMN oxidoreductase RutF
MLLVCIHRNSPCAAAIARTGMFCVNLLSEDAKATACLFAGTSGEARHLRFDRVAWTEGQGNCPILDESVTAFECAVSDSVQIATHRIFFAMVVGAKSGRGAAPLIYSDRAFRRLAALERQI